MEAEMTDYAGLTVTRKNGVATVAMSMKRGDGGGGGAQSHHSTVGRALNDLRFDNSIRVVILTGEDDVFYSSPVGRPRMENRDPAEDWDLTQGMQFTFQTIIDMEKPVIAKVNGRAASFGGSMVFACDFIIAAEDAPFGDPHIGMGEGALFPMGRTDSGTVPGDGSNAFVPLYLSPALAREYLWLARQFTGADLARMGIINAAVPRAELDAAVDRMADALMRRPPYALALSKRAFNKFIADRFNQTFDLAWSYEALNFYQFGRYRGPRGTETL
jgi:enoyl-CoA hydratase